ncbi:MAG: AAA family ATPase [Evtepia sp.]|uniref:ATP-binding protein n=1 Tax=Evtepia sp. TaxID=2773933 RepID=UPI002A750B1C|nr:AAA family ATPase [Evtepia sp.]MDY3013771.1 AAA family ATPase [Evtepia sp.]
MKLLKLTATFGCLDHETLEFSPGMNLIGAPNGSGKSTWCAFLRTMLYGLDTRQRDRKGAPADKNRYRPWSGAPMEGQLLCEHQGRTILLQRTSAGGVPMGDFSATDQETGLPVPGLTADNVGEVLTGVSREIFDRSVFLRQTGLAVSQSQDLEKRIAALVAAGEEDVSWSESDERLKTWQRRRRYHKTGLLPQLEEEEAQLRASLEQTASLRQELAQVQSRAAGLRRQKEHWDSRLSIENDKFKTVSQQRYAQAAAELDAAELRVQTLRGQMEKAPHTPDSQRNWEEEIQEIQDELRSRHRMMVGFVVVILLLTLVAAALYILPHIPQFPLSLPTIPLWIPAVVAGVLWLLVLIFSIIKVLCDRQDHKDLKDLHYLVDTSEKDHSEQARSLQEALLLRDQARKLFEAISQQRGSGPYLPPEAEVCRESLHRAEQEIAQLQGQLSALGDPALIDARLDNVQEEKARLQEEYDALTIAMEAMQEADDQLHARFSPQVSRRAEGYFTQLTPGDYHDLSLTRSMEVTLRQGPSLARHPLALLSQGTADQLYLALRLAVADLVFPDPRDCPLILDDALLTFDDRNLARALALLCRLAQEEGRQILLFTCQHREFRMLQDLDGVACQSLHGF